jgi:hypothetical protein
VTAAPRRRSEWTRTKVHRYAINLTHFATDRAAYLGQERKSQGEMVAYFYRTDTEPGSPHITAFRHSVWFLVNKQKIKPPVFN